MLAVCAVPTARSAAQRLRPPSSLVGSTRGLPEGGPLLQMERSLHLREKKRLWVALGAEPVATGTNQAQGRLGLGGRRPGRVCCLTSSGISAGLSPAPVSPRHISCGAGRAQV